MRLRDLPDDVQDEVAEQEEERWWADFLRRRNVPTAEEHLRARGILPPE